MESQPIIDCFITFKLLLSYYSGMLVRLVCNPDADEPMLTNSGTSGGNQYVCMYVCMCFQTLEYIFNLKL